MIKVMLTKRRRVYSTGATVQYWTLRWRGTDAKWYSEAIGQVTKMSKAEAEDRRRAKLIAMGSGQLPVNRPRPITLADYLQHDRQAIAGDVRPRTLLEHDRVTAHALAALGSDIKLHQLSQAHVGRVKSYLRAGVDIHGKAKQSLSTETVRKVLAYLRAALNRAVAEGLHHQNVFIGFDLGEPAARPKRIFTSEEIDAMIKSAPSSWWNAFLRLALGSGLRKGELLNLTWRDIDFGVGTVTVQPKRARSFSVDGRDYPIIAWQAKTSHSYRTVPLSEQAVAALARWQQESDGSAYVFVNLNRLNRIRDRQDAGKPLAEFAQVNNLGRQYEAIQEAARALLADRRRCPLSEVDWPLGTIHDLRKTYGTMLARAVPMHVLKRLMGHSNIKTTEKFYLDVTESDERAVRSALDSQMTGHDEPKRAHLKRTLGKKTRIHRGNRVTTSH